MYCNICGSWFERLITSHTLTSARKRTGRILIICSSCHINYHNSRDDFKAWGKQSAEKRRKSGTNNISLARKGLKYIKYRGGK